MISLIISMITVAWVYMQLAAFKLATEHTPNEPVSEAAEAQPGAPAGAGDAQPPKMQERSNVEWQPGMPPPMPMPTSFTEVTQVEQDPLLDESAFENTE